MATPGFNVAGEPATSAVKAIPHTASTASGHDASATSEAGEAFPNDVGLAPGPVGIAPGSVGEPKKGVPKGGDAVRAGGVGADAPEGMALVGKPTSATVGMPPGLPGVGPGPPNAIVS